MVLTRSEYRHVYPSDKGPRGKRTARNPANTGGKTSRRGKDGRDFSRVDGGFSGASKSPRSSRTQFLRSTPNKCALQDDTKEQTTESVPEIQETDDKTSLRNCKRQSEPEMEFAFQTPPYKTCKLSPSGGSLAQASRALFGTTEDGTARQDNSPFKPLPLLDVDLSPSSSVHGNPHMSTSNTHFTGQSATCFSPAKSDDGISCNFDLSPNRGTKVKFDTQRQWSFSSDTFLEETVHCCFDSDPEDITVSQSKTLSFCSDDCDDNRMKSPLFFGTQDGSLALIDCKTPTKGPGSGVKKARAEFKRLLDPSLNAQADTHDIVNTETASEKLKKTFSTKAPISSRRTKCTISSPEGIRVKQEQSSGLQAEPNGKKIMPLNLDIVPEQKETRSEFSCILEGNYPFRPFNSVVVNQEREVNVTSLGGNRTSSGEMKLRNRFITKTPLSEGLLTCDESVIGSLGSFGSVSPQCDLDKKNQLNNQKTVKTVGSLFGVGNVKEEADSSDVGKVGQTSKEMWKIVPKTENRTKGATVLLVKVVK
ncbi:uncharacterized protein LOC106162087 isoform X1 [Lingula anatina]|uniref:Uncharacterized protein LOC106162087 isoform X1 n=1 Tax=Lingula anatina TaxID=7574 RepID=A0A1S3I8T2_LINAN|nr:uncharacterized protein LOC106162087 isoform X1 [Lingula anatina]|eukprot:XP_013394670.1 uncharacterized protein LOC106162087 isoform X1 [Lingula anatina]